MSTTPIQIAPVDAKPAWHELVLAIDDAASRFVAQLSMDSDAMRHLTTWLTHETTSTRYELYNSPDVVFSAWADIDRAGSDAIDFVTEITSSMLLEIAAHGPEYRTRFMEGIARALSVHGVVGDGEWSALGHSDEAERWLTYDQAVAMIDANPWVAALYLMRRTDYCRMQTAMAVKYRTEQLRAQQRAEAEARAAG